jgi:hypothetical protein
MSAEIPSFTRTEDLPVYAVTSDTAQSYRGAAPRPLVQRLTMGASGYALNALAIRIVSGGRRQSYLNAAFMNFPRLEVALAASAVSVYLAPFVFGYVALMALPKLVRDVRAAATDRRRFALPKVPLRANRRPIVRTISWVVVSVVLGLAVAPALAIRASILLGAVQALVALLFFCFEIRRGVQLVEFWVRKGLRSRHMFLGFYHRGEIWPMEDALKHANSPALSTIAVRFIYDGRYDDAMTLLKARFARVAEAHVAVNIACCLTRLKQNDEALTWLRKADALLPLTKKAMRLSSLRPLRKAGLLDEFASR